MPEFEKVPTWVPLPTLAVVTTNLSHNVSYLDTRGGTLVEFLSFHLSKSKMSDSPPNDDIIFSSKHFVFIILVGKEERSCSFRANAFYLLKMPARNRAKQFGRRIGAPKNK